MYQKPAVTKANPKPTVVLVHGIASKGFWMTFLGARLRKLGYTTVTFSYNSLVGSIEKHASRLSTSLGKREGEYHIVAHSMGGIVTRVAINQGVLAGLRRVVLIAPPNQGSPIARLLSPVFHPVCPAMTQLSSAPGSFVQSLGHPMDVDLGIISAKYDVMVPHRKTLLEQAKDHKLIAGSHNSLLFQSDVARYVDCFLQSGNFGDDV